LAALAERAARLAKADLVTGMVGEFPELQGLMGGYYAAAQGEPAEVAEAIRDHYKPVGQGDAVPVAPVTVAVSLADKLDTLVGFFLEGVLPTGSSDPFALRRAVIGIISTIERLGIRAPLERIINFQIRAYDLPRIQRLKPELPASLSDLILEMLASPNPKFADELIAQARYERDEKLLAVLMRAVTARAKLLDFFADRLKVQQREAGVRHDLIDAVFALGGEDDLVRLLARVHALQAFVATEDGVNLLAGYKRAANILKKEGIEPVAPAQAGAHVSSSEGGSSVSAEMGSRLRESDDGSYAREPQEAALLAALDAAEPRADAAVAAEDFEGAMAALAGLRAPIDAFFEAVTVNDPDPDKRAARLALPARGRAAVHRVADFSRIEG
jgi:glycyl-tRNA synthetase beta chain